MSAIRYARHPHDTHMRVTYTGMGVGAMATWHCDLSHGTGLNDFNIIVPAQASCLPPRNTTAIDHRVPILRDIMLITKRQLGGVALGWISTHVWSIERADRGADVTHPRRAKIKPGGIADEGVYAHMLIDGDDTGW